MNPFSLARPKDHAAAHALLTGRRFSLPLLKGGGMDVVDHLKEGLWKPDVVIDTRQLRAPGASAPISKDGQTIRIEAWATMSEIAASDIVLKDAPCVAHAVGSAASPQVRNVGTAAGNLLQRPRCWYYRNEQFQCLKKGGGTCFAFEGENKFHAIFGEGPCYIVHPSNLAPALCITDAVVHLHGGKRASLPITDLYHTPDKGIRTEHNLEPGEIITHITLSPAPVSGFYAIKEKQSFDWPLAFACAALQLDGSKIRTARVCAGAVAPVPWLLPGVDAALKGVDLDDDKALRAACAKATEGARPLSQNAYKLTLLPVAVRRAVLVAAGKKVEA
ncbi:MAG: FAD binding domain-containing protein [Phycisphaerales bacterium]|nr:FAD binding domain-containing protein [Phycisphaerales bacterium]